MADKNISRAIGLAAYNCIVGTCLIVLTGCVGYSKDTPYDPVLSRGETLFDQIPNNEGESLNRCAGHLDPKDRKPWQTGRC